MNTVMSSVVSQAAKQRSASKGSNKRDDCNRLFFVSNALKSIYLTPNSQYMNDVKMDGETK